MAFGDWLRGVVAQVNPWDNGANFETYNPRKKRQDEQNSQRSVSSVPQIPSNPNQPQQQQQDRLKPQAPQNLFHGIQTNLMLPGSQPVNKVAVKPQPSKVEQDINALTEQKLGEATKEVENGQNWIDKSVNFFTHNNERLARQNARTKAVNAYQEQNGWNNDGEVQKFNQRTMDMGRNNTRQIKTQGDNLNKFQDTVYKGAGALQYVPVAGSVLNLGLAGAESLGNRDVRETRNKLDFGMSNAEFDTLDPETKDKLGIVRNIGLAASPLDFTGLGGLAKTEGLSLAKKGIVQLVKERAIDAATRAGLKTAAKSTVKAAVPASLLGGAVSAGGQAYLTGEVDPLEAAKAALVTGGTSMLLPSQSIRRTPGAAINEATDVAQSAADGLKEGATKIKVQQPRDINVSDESPAPFDVPVSNNSTPKPEPKPIVEVSGDTPGVNKIEVPSANERAAQQFAAQPSSKPDYSVEGINSPDRVITSADKAQAQSTIDDALQTGKIDENQHKDLTDQLSQIRAQDEAAPKGKPINVQDIKSIPVTDQTTVPTNLPETPGAVRVTDTIDPNAARSADVAAKAPIQLPLETQAVLDNPKQFNKRQVAAARNQRKLATQMAKTQEQTAEAMARIQSASPAAQSGEGFVPTGEFGKGRNGAIQKVHRQTELAQGVQETANLSPVDVIRTARENSSVNGGFSRRDIRNIHALLETERIAKGTPEYNEVKAILAQDGAQVAQSLALRGGVKFRRTASPDELLNQFESKIYRMVDDPTKVDSKLFDDVEAATVKYTDTRDAAVQAYNHFTENPTSANAKAFHVAQDAADQADRQSKQVEFKIAKTLLKGNKDVKQARELEKMAQSADMYQMDAIDASMLGGTGTFARNFANASIGSLEEGLMGRVSARIAGKLTGEKVGGGGLVRGIKKGAVNVVDASKARADAAGKNPLEHLKNWATTGNQLGDTVIDAQVSRNVGDHYTQLLKDQGYKGSELRNRASVMSRQDPDNISETYQAAARTAAGLGSGITRNNKIESLVKNVISDAISGGNPNAATETIAKVVTRMTLGFPTAITRSATEGVKRFTLGTPTFIKAMATKDPQTRALLIKEGIKQAGTGGVIIPSLFYGLGASGAITGAYPEDQAERDRWAREGISENSIKIGNDYYQLPAYLGSWAIPALFYASLGRNGGDWGAAAGDSAKVVPSLLPVDSMDKWIDLVNGRTDPGKFLAQTGSSAVRAATPGGALLSQLAKSFDPTQNETNSGTVLENLVSKVINGIPGASLGLENKTDAEGNVLANPDPLALGLGASSTSQTAGVERSAELNGQTNSAIDSMNKLGAFADPNIKAVITDDKTKKIYNNILAGKQVSPDDIKKVQEAMVKGVSATGDDTAYLEREQYDTNVAVLNVKRELMASDPTTKPSDLKKIDTAIKRGEIYRDNTIPYELIDAYQNTGLDEWRKMGDPEKDEYNPDAYQKLWAIDEMMAKAGVSYKKGALDKQKYSAKQAGKGRGKGSRGGFSADFGTLKAGTGAPKVQEYDTLDQKSGGVPLVKVQRPNIVHKISSS